MTSIRGAADRLDAPDLTNEIGQAGEPKDSEPARTLSTTSFIARQQVCQPLAINPFQRLACALRIEMKPLRIELARDDLFFGDGTEPASISCPL